MYMHVLYVLYSLLFWFAYTQSFIDLFLLWLFVVYLYVVQS